MAPFVNDPNAHSFFLVVQGNRARAVQMMADLRASDPEARVSHAIDLSEAYNLSEHSQPDLVFLDQDMVNASGLPMFLSLLSALAIDWTVVITGRPQDRIPLRRRVQIGALKSFVKNDWTPRRAKCQSHAARSSIHHGAQPQAPSNNPLKTVVIGASTGGIEALITVLSGFPADGPPTLIVQHINSAFLPGLADRLDRICAPCVRAAQAGDLLQPGQVLMAPGDCHHLVVSEDGKTCQFDPGPPRNGHRPSVDALFSSAAKALGCRSVGVILSGMGCDGAAGLLDIRRSGGWTIGQDRESSIVYGMPRAAFEADAVREQLSLTKISDAILKRASANTKRLHNV